MNLTVRKVFIFTLPDPKQKTTENFRQRAEPSRFSWKRRSKGNPNHVFFFPTVNSSKNPTCVFGMATWHRWVHGFVNIMGLCIELQHLQLQSETPPQKNNSSTVFFLACFLQAFHKEIDDIHNQTYMVPWFVSLPFSVSQFIQIYGAVFEFFLFDESLWRTNKWLPRNRKDTKILPHPCSWSYEMICVRV